MTKQEAWIRFMAGALADGNTSVTLAADCADMALEEMLKRWPETEGDDPVAMAEEGGKEGT